MPDYRAVAVQAAQRYGINPAIFLRQINQESGFNPNARSPAGAVGIAQIVPRWHPGVNPSDPVASLNYAARMMSQLVQKYGNWQQALSVYNSGNPNAYKDANFSGGQTYRYVRSIMGGANVPVTAAAPTPAALPPPGVPNAGGLSPGLLRVMQSTNAMLGLPALHLPVSAFPGVSPSVTPTPTATPTGFSATWLRPGAKLIGAPYQGTHAKAFNVAGGSNNWQSENALDISLPVGTPIYAPVGGKLGATGPTGESGRFAGTRINLFGGGNGFYFAHLSRLAKGIKEGATVKKGQLLGYSGEANGVDHLHFAVENGSPYSYYGR